MEEQIKARLIELETSRAALVENLAAHNGAIAELKRLLAPSEPEQPKK